VQRVVRTPVVLKARSGLRDSRCAWFRSRPVVEGVILCWAWFRSNARCGRRDTVRVWSAHAVGSPERRFGSPNTALQLTASRARSLLFERLYPARSRQLNARPLGGSHQRLSQRGMSSVVHSHMTFVTATLVRYHDHINLQTYNRYRAAQRSSLTQTSLSCKAVTQTQSLCSRFAASCCPTTPDT